MKYRFCIIFLLTFFHSYGQGNPDTGAMYKNAMALFEKDETFEAIAELDKVIKIDSNHIGALYSLAIINAQLGDHVTAIKLLRRCMKLNDKKSIKLLKDKFHQEISYADTMQNIPISTWAKYAQLKSLKVKSIDELAKRILAVSTQKREQLHLLLLWSFDHMRPDADRFFDGGVTLSIEESLVKGYGLCDEYSNILREFCKLTKIPNFKIAGYVKYPEFKSRDTFDQPNHAWNAVYLDNVWLICDLFWSTTALDINGASQPSFVKRLDTDYFLGLPTAINNDHMPSDPIFQFDNYPLPMEAFTNKANGIDTSVKRMKYLNFADSIVMLTKLNSNEQAVRMAYHSYLFNKANPNDLITESYNYAVEIINKKSPSKVELKNARQNLVLALSIIDLSKSEEIRTLKESCKTGVSRIDKILALTAGKTP